MKSLLFILSALAVAVLSSPQTPVFAQDCGCSAGCSTGCATANVGCAGGCAKKSDCCPGIVGPDGMTQPVDTVIATNPVATLRFAMHDHYSPNHIYAYSKHGVEAGWTNLWNQQQMNCYPWHGSHSYWRFGTPTALVVPPTAAFQTTYRWGVGQTTSDPINHQFGRGGGRISNGGEGLFRRAPYWPSSTNQFGVYPVRGPWN